MERRPWCATVHIFAVRDDLATKQLMNYIPKGDI